MIIDTNILIHWINGDERIIEFLSIHDNKTFYTSIISEMEVRMGWDKHDINDEEMEEIMKAITVVPLSTKIGNLTVEYLRKKGLKSLRHPSLQDTIIAATALHLNQPLVTRNEKDFKRFKGLKLINPFK